MSFTAGTVQLPALVAGDEPVQFKYFDSQPASSEGAAPSTTIIAVHGVAFNSAIWEPWLPSLREKNIRLLSYNRRGYEGSSPIYEEPEPSKGLLRTTGRYTLDMLGFMKFAIEELDIKPKDENTKAGGIVLMGWSKGCVPPMVLMTNLQHIKQSRIPLPMDISPFYPMLESHLRSIVLYEPPGSAAGRAPTKDAEELAVDASQIATVFYNWVERKISPEDLPALKKAWEGERTSHDFSWLLAPDRAGIERVAFQAFDPVPPNLGVGLLLGSEASEYCVDAGNWINARLADQPHTSKAIIPGAGHFAMITHPDQLTMTIVELINVLGT